MNKVFSLVLGSFILITGFVAIPLVDTYAVSTRQQLCTGSGGIWGKEKDSEGREFGDVKCLSNDANGPSVTKTIQNVINTLLFVVGMAAVIVIVIAGFRMVTANGDSQAVAKARSSIIYAVVGIVVAVSAYAIVNFILDQFK